MPQPSNQSENPAATPSDRSWKVFWLPIAVALAIHAALGISAARQLTTTHDEYWHLPVGLLNLRTGRFHFDNLNPPLCRMTAALPLIFTSAQTGPTDGSRAPMGWGDAFLEQNAPRYTTWFAIGRSMIVVISVLGGLATAYWARELFGNGAGCLAAILWAFEPNLLAHGSLVTTDMGAAAFFVFTLYAVSKFAAQPNWKTSLVFGGVLGLAQLAKFTSLILYPVSVVVFALMTIVRHRENSQDAADSGAGTGTRISKILVMWAVSLVFSLAVLNAGYLFRGSFSSLRAYAFQSAAMRSVANELKPIGWLPVPLPRDYVQGVDNQRQVMEHKQPVFLDGEWSEDGFPHYYLWAMFYKLPHALPLLAIAVVFWIVMPGDRPRRAWMQAILLVPAITMIASAETSRMQLGVRYVLPAIPFLILFASQAARWLDLRKFPIRSLATIVLAGWMVLSLRYHPHHLAYFNELAGGPSGGREHLLDSNLDWGQDLGGLSHFVEARGFGEIGLAYFGTVPPSSMGIKYHIPPVRSPQPGRYAISVNFEQGRPSGLRTPPMKDRSSRVENFNIGDFSYFAFFQPVARIGYSIDVFELTDRDVAEWQAAIRQASGR